MRKEVFKDVFNYEGLYQISNYGRVKSLERKSIFYCGLRKEYLKRRVKEKFLSFNKSNNGYIQVCLTKNGKCKTFILHRLVAQAFIPNPENKPQINHIDGNKENNCVDNLEWCDASENMQHASKTGLLKSNVKRSVNQYDLNGNFITTWDSITDFLKAKGLNIKSSNITSCCRGNKKSAYGYKWKYNDNR